MNVLVIGGGGREHALCIEIAKSPLLTKLICAPGNHGISNVAGIADISVKNHEAIIELCQNEEIQLVVIGPEEPLAMGLADKLRKLDIFVFGVNRKEAKLESSKTFAKEFMLRNNIPTAESQSFYDIESALSYIHEKGAPLVIKADGLAAGKGVAVTHTMEETENALYNCMEKKRFGEAGDCVLIEEFLTGEEASIFLVIDSSGYVRFPMAQDHKPLLDDDLGPNTGGMGSYAPVDHLNKYSDRIDKQVIEPILKGIRKEFPHYRGVLYVSLMISESRIDVIEFNVRFGDPEAQIVLPLLQSDLLEMLWMASQDNLSNYEVSFHDKYGVCVVLVSGGYPDQYQTHLPILGITDDSDENIIHSGTLHKNGVTISNGGRVLCVRGVSNSLEEAQSRAYENISGISFEGCHYRKDIAHKALKAKL